jgi:hypothetical protein
MSDKRFTKYRFRRGEQVIVSGTHSIDGEEFPWVATVMEPASEEMDGDLVVVAICPDGGSSMYRVLPFNDPRVAERRAAGRKNIFIATPLHHPNVDDSGNLVGHVNRLNDRREMYVPPTCSRYHDDDENE